MLTYNISLGFGCQLSKQWKQTERKGNMPFKTEAASTNHLSKMESSSLPVVHWITVQLLPSLPIAIMDLRPFLLASVAPRTGVKVVDFPISWKWDLVIWLVLAKWMWAMWQGTKVIRGTVCFDTLLCASAITMRQACPGDPGIRNKPRCKCSLEPSSAKLTPDQVNLSQFLGQWMGARNSCCKPLRFGAHLLK